jgi:hypothetical protein
VVSATQKGIAVKIVSRQFIGEKEWIHTKERLTKGG